MAKVLTISSQVVHGHVGNSSTTLVLQRMGHEVLGLPTIILSNRPGYAAISGTRMSIETLDGMLEAVASNGWLADIDAIMTGYLPSPAHVEFSAKWIAKIRALKPGVLYFCDPILGDDPAGIYIDEAAACAVRDLLIPMADVLTPNAFELGWLTGRDIRDPADAVSAARQLGGTVLVTSAPAGEQDKLANILVEGENALATTVSRRKVHAHGTGDFFASLFLARKLNGAPHEIALRTATAAMDKVLDLSEGQPELALVQSQEVWAQPNPPLAEAASIPQLGAK